MNLEEFEIEKLDFNKEKLNLDVYARISLKNVFAKRARINLS